MNRLIGIGTILGLFGSIFLGIDCLILLIQTIGAAKTFFGLAYTFLGIGCLLYLIGFVLDKIKNR